MNGKGVCQLWSQLWTKITHKEHEHDLSVPAGFCYTLLMSHDSISVISTRVPWIQCWATIFPHSFLILSFPLSSFFFLLKLVKSWALPVSSPSVQRQYPETTMGSVFEVENRIAHANSRLALMGLMQAESRASNEVKHLRTLTQS